MTKDDYTIKGERFDISETMTAVSLSNADGHDTGKFVLRLESEDGKEMSIVMNYIQTIPLRSFVNRIEKKNASHDAMRQRYDEEAPSLFSTECEAEILLSDGKSRTFDEIVRDVAFGLALPTDFYGGFSDYHALFVEDLDFILTSMTKDGKVECLHGEVFRMTDAALAETRFKAIGWNYMDENSNANAGLKNEVM